MNLFKQIAFPVAVIFIFSTSVYPQISPKSLGDENCWKTIDFFRTSISIAGKPGGLAITEKSCPDNAAFSELRESNLPLDKKLDSIIQNIPGYKWRNEQGVINLYPSKSVPKLLKTKIKEFKITFDANNLSIFVDTLLQKLEVTKLQKKLNIRQGMSFGGLQSPPSGRPPIVLTFRDKTVQEILNEVLIKRGRGCWLYRESIFNGENTYSLQFIQS